MPKKTARKVASRAKPRGSMSNRMTNKLVKRGKLAKSAMEYRTKRAGRKKKK